MGKEVSFFASITANLTTAFTVEYGVEIDDFRFSFGPSKYIVTSSVYIVSIDLPISFQPSLPNSVESAFCPHSLVLPPQNSNQEKPLSAVVAAGSQHKTYRVFIFYVSLVFFDTEKYSFSHCNSVAFATDRLQPPGRKMSLQVYINSVYLQTPYENLKRVTITHNF